MKRQSQAANIDCHILLWGRGEGETPVNYKSMTPSWAWRMAPAAAAWAAYFLLGLAVYGRAVSYPFLLDDTFHFAGNPTIRAWAGLHTVWTTNYWEDAGASGLYRPLLKTIWMAEIIGLGGGKAALLFVSLAIHALNGLLVCALARKGGLARAFAFGAGLWFLLHPAHTEAILSCVGQGEIFSLAIALGALLPVFPDRNTPSAESRSCAEQPLPSREGSGEGRFGASRITPAIRPALATLLLAAGFFVKEQIYPAALLTVIAILMNSAFTPRAKALTISSIVLAGAAAIAIRLHVLGHFGPRDIYQLGGELGLAQRIPLTFHILGRFVALAFVPIQLNPDYSWIKLLLPINPRDPIVWLGIVAALACAIALLLPILRRRRTGLLFGLAALIPLGPFLGLQSIGTLFAERHAYHALAGLALCLALAISRLISRRENAPSRNSPARLAAGGLILWALLLGWRASRQTPLWTDGLTLWAAACKAEPRNYFAWGNLAYYEMTAREFGRARESAMRALKLAPTYPDAHMTLGELDLNAGRPAAARAHYEQALYHPSFEFRARAGMALADARLGRIADARAAWEALKKARPEDPLLSALAGEIGRAASRPAPQGGEAAPDTMPAN